ncbi:MAG: UDP-3-O-(3-hydroxymyristoyl)glucosamine N-acyltransferase [Myxococcota bacterium]|nr:UDP-3-O-(3-hydroxymyristoyl)glucosamine N-acyltransferase [Myxococcota bacterium]
MRASDLAAREGGQLVGDDREFDGVAALDTAGPSDLAFHDGTESPVSDAGVLLVRQALPGRTCVVVEDPKLAFIHLLADWFVDTHLPGVHPGATVDPSARLGEGVVVYPGCWVGPGVSVGDRTVLFPNVVLHAGTQVGQDCRIHAGCVLGADGFSFHPTSEGPVKVPQVGRVRVEDRVELGANCCIDRAFLGETVVGPGSKLDNLVHVGHNARLGRHVLVAAQAGLSGSVSLGDGVMVGGQVGIVEHVQVGDGARIGAQSGVHREVAAGTTVLGTPAVALARARRIYAAWKHLPEIWRATRPRDEDE